MEALAVWLKQIILVVLLATFIDLLLPNRTLQRYVKLVVSLFILMTILSPVMSLLGSNVNMRMLAATVEGWDLSGMPQEAANRQGSLLGTDLPRSKSIPALSDLLSEGEAIGAKQNAESLKLLELTMESMVKEQIESQHGVAVVEANAALALDADRFPIVERLTVLLGTGPPGSGASGSSGAAEAASEGDSGGWAMVPVKPMEPVDIRIDAKGGTESRDILPAITGDDKLPKELQGKKKDIVESLAQQWNVDEKRIVIKQLQPGAATRE